MFEYNVGDFALLYDFAQDLYRFTGYLYTWGWNNKDHWVGSIIITPAAYALGDIMGAAATQMDFASGAVDDLLLFISDILDGSLLDHILDTLVSDWADFRADPVYWVITKVTEFWPDFYWFAQDPVYMVEFWVTEFWADLPDVITSPDVWILGKIDTIWPDFYWFRQDPGTMVRFWLTEQWPELETILDTPMVWLRALLSELFGVDDSFWDDPLANLREGIAFNLVTGISAQRNALYDVGEHLLRYFFEGVW